MGALLKQGLQLLSGQMAGSNHKAAFVVKTLRMGYISTGTAIAVLWYSAYRNERVSPGTIDFPFPGISKKKRQFSPDRPEKELPREQPSPAAFDETKGNPITSPGLPPLFSGAIPRTPQAARKLQGLVLFENKPVAAWIAPFLQYAKTQGWTGQLTQGWRSYSEEVSIWNSGTRPAAHPGTSNHGKKNFPGGAADVTQPKQLAEILSKLPGGSLLKWAGSKDEVHFSFPHNGSY